MTDNDMNTLVGFGLVFLAVCVVAKLLGALFGRGGDQQLQNMDAPDYSPPFGSRQQDIETRYIQLQNNRKPFFNVDGTPMNGGMFDVKGKPYGMVSPPKPPR